MRRVTATFLPSLVGAMALSSACAHRSDGGGVKGSLVSVGEPEGLVDRAFSGRRFALLVGINEPADTRWRPLRFAAKDAEDLAAMFRDTAVGAFESVTVLTSPKETTRDRIIAAIHALATQATRPEDIVVVYFSAHGTLARDGGGGLRRYLVTSDADFHRVSETALAVDALPQLLRDSASKRRVLFLATCHSGSGKSLFSGETAAELAQLKGPAPLPPLEEASRASLIFSASDWGETAREDEALENDVYTHFLVEALSGAGDRNGDGAVSATEAHDFARRRTWRFSQGRQRPSAEIVEVGADPVILAGRIQRAGQPELYSYATRLDGFTLTVDGEARTELPGGVALSRGAHHVELTKGADHLLQEDVHLEVGQRLDVEELVTRAEPSRSVALLGGGFAFLDAKSRAEILPGGAAVGLAARVDRVLLGRIGLEADVSGFGGLSGITVAGGAVPMTWRSLQVGVSALWAWDLRWLSLWAGPRLAGLWVNRTFTLAAYQGSQSALSVTPGIMIGGAVRLGARWEIFLNLQAVLTMFAVDGQTQLLGFAGGFGGVGYRF